MAIIISTAVAILCLVASTSGKSIKSASSLTRCEDDGTDVDCTPTLIIATNVNSGENELEDISVAPVDGEDVESDLNFKYSINMIAEEVDVIYDLTYYTDFNKRPYEAIIYGPVDSNGASCYTGNSDFCFGVGPLASHTCEDGNDNENPSCGWVYDSSWVTQLTNSDTCQTADDACDENCCITSVTEMTSISWDIRKNHVYADSQGFCCSCDFGDFTSTPDDISRSGLDCNIFDGDSPHASAHCFRNDDMWYSAYEISSPTEVIQVTVVVSKSCNDPSGCTVDEVEIAYGQNIPDAVEYLTVGSSTTRAQTPDGKVIVEWALFAGTESYADLSDTYLFKPRCYGDVECETAYLAEVGTEITDLQRWLLISKSEVDVSGNTCNKLGVSYSGFRNQADACNKAYDTCLESVGTDAMLYSSARLSDYLEFDMEQVSRGKNPTYFPQGVYPDEDLHTDETQRLRWTMSAVRTSELTITIKDADLDTLVATRSISSKITTVFAEVACANKYTSRRNLGQVVTDGMPVSTDSEAVPIECGIEGESDDGILYVVVENAGSNSDAFEISTDPNQVALIDDAGNYDFDSGYSAVGASFGASKLTSTLAPQPCNTVDDDVANVDCNSCADDYVLELISEFDLVHADVNDVYSSCETVKFDILAMDLSGAKYCMNITVKNGVGAVLDVTEHCWNTIYRETHQLNGGVASFTSDGELYAASFTCSDVCPGSFDIFCMMSVPACQENIFIFLGIIICTVLFCIVARKTGLAAMCKFCMKKKSKHHHKKKGKKNYNSSSSDSSSSSSSESSSGSSSGSSSSGSESDDEESRMR